MLNHTEFEEILNSVKQNENNIGLLKTPNWYIIFDENIIVHYLTKLNIDYNFIKNTDSFINGTSEDSSLFRICIFRNIIKNFNINKNSNYQIIDLIYSNYSIYSISQKYHNIIIKNNILIKENEYDIDLFLLDISESEINKLKMEITL